MGRTAEELHKLRDWLRSPLLCSKDLMRHYNISESTLHRWMRQSGILPDPVRIACPRWRLADLLAAEAAGRLPCPDPDNPDAACPG